MKIEIDVRPEVARFALLMEEVLKRHDDEYGGSRGWKLVPTEHLQRWMIGETLELADALTRMDPPEIGTETADIANLCMMIADNNGSLPELQP